MRHRVAGKVLNADTQHRLALRRNLSRSLFLHGRIVTTLAKAKATRRFTEKLITRARRALAAKAAGDTARWIHQVRVLARDVKDTDVLRKLLAEVAPRANRPGGYTRIVRDWKNQVGDNAPRAIFELVDRLVEEPPRTTTRRRRRARRGRPRARPAADSLFQGEGKEGRGGGAGRGRMTPAGVGLVPPTSRAGLGLLVSGSLVSGGAFVAEGPAPGSCSRRRRRRSTRSSASSSTVPSRTRRSASPSGGRGRPLDATRRAARPCDRLRASVRGPAAAPGSDRSGR